MTLIELVRLEADTRTKLELDVQLMMCRINELRCKAKDAGYETTTWSKTLDKLLDMSDFPTELDELIG